MIERIIIAGSGGQGIMLLGKVIAEAAMRCGRQVTWFPAYGAEVRGGTAYCMVTISDKQIGSPYIDKADTLIIMNGPSLEKFRQRIKNKGSLIVNSSLAAVAGKEKRPSLKHPFTDIAIRLGNIKVANMVALGCYLAAKNIISVDDVMAVFKDMAKSVPADMLKINQRALREGVGLRHG